MLGIILTDCWLGYKYAIKLAERRSKRRHKHHDITLQDFTDWMASALIHNPYQWSTEPEFVNLAMLSEYDTSNKTTDTESTTTGGNATSTTAGSTVLGKTSKGSISSITYESLKGKTHSVCKFIRKYGKESRQRCRWCTHMQPVEKNIRAWHYCHECKAAFCHPGPRMKRNCFLEHVKKPDQWLRWEYSRRLERQKHTEARVLRNKRRH